MQKRTVDFLLQQNILKGVALYAATQHEVETTLIAEACLKKGIPICYPAILSRLEPLAFYEITDLKQLKPSRYGVLAPKKGAKLFPADHLEVLCVPGILFDERGYRMGYGKGYYDRTLSKFKAIKVGLAYDFQVIKELPTSPHDERVDMIISEKRHFMIRKKDG